MAELCPLFSGSTGNSYYIGSKSSGILVDIGRSCKQVTTVMQRCGIDPLSVQGILITHEHSDHIAGVRVFAKKYGIPVFAFELKNQFTGQTVENAKQQWMHDRDPREVCFQFNKRILGYFCVDLTEVWMATRLAGKDTRFLPFNQGSNGAGRDGGAAAGAGVKLRKLRWG